MDMTFSYVDPLNDPKDKVRLIVGDTNPDRPLIYDEEITAAMELYPKKYLGTVYRTMANRLAMISKRQIGDQTEDYSAAIQYLHSMADRQEQASSGGVRLNIIPSKPIFTIGMNDNRRGR